MKRVFWIALIAVLSQGTAFADGSGDQMMEMLKKMQQQMTDMQRTMDSQAVRIRELESNHVVEAPQPAVQTQMSEADWQKGIKDNIGEAIPFLKGAKYGGDFRLRMENFDYSDNNPDESVTSDRSRNRYRVRLRWGFEKDYGDDWKVGFRLASATAGTNGLATDNASTNVTLGNPGYFTYKNIYFDRAYAAYSPNGLKDYGILKGVTIGAGKFENPFLRYSTTIVWDADVTPEGLYEKANLQFVSTEENKVNLYLTSGQFLANENSGWETDAQVFAYQGALNWSTYNFGGDQPVDFTIAASFYDYPNWFQTVSNNTVSTSFLRTNTLFAEDWHVLDIYPEIVFYANGMPVTLWGDYAKNLANFGTEDALVADNLTIHDTDDAWGVGLKVGKMKKKGDWEAFYGYYEIGANSVVAAFNDSDFGGPGGVGHTNRQGHKFGVGYQLTDAITVNWTGYVVSPLNPNTAVANSLNEEVFRSQLDLVLKF